MSKEWMVDIMKIFVVAVLEYMMGRITIVILTVDPVLMIVFILIVLAFLLLYLASRKPGC